MGLCILVLRETCVITITYKSSAYGLFSGGGGSHTWISVSE